MWVRFPPASYSSSQNKRMKEEIKSWLDEKPNITRLELYSGVFIGALIANIILDLIK